MQVSNWWGGGEKPRLVQLPIYVSSPGPGPSSPFQLLPPPLMGLTPPLPCPPPSCLTPLTRCSELRGVSLPLVDAFAIPDHILRAPIGLSNAGAADVYKEYLLAAGFE